METKKVKIEMVEISDYQKSLNELDTMKVVLDGHREQEKKTVSLCGGNIVDSIGQYFVELFRPFFNGDGTCKYIESFGSYSSWASVSTDRENNCYTIYIKKYMSYRISYSYEDDDVVFDFFYRSGMPCTDYSVIDGYDLVRTAKDWETTKIYIDDCLTNIIRNEKISTQCAIDDSKKNNDILMNFHI